MNDGYMDAAAVPVPDAGDDALRLGVAEAIGAHTERCSCCPTIETGEASGLVAALLPRVREHVAAAVQAERERIRRVEALREYWDEHDPYRVGIHANQLRAALDGTEAP